MDNSNLDEMWNTYTKGFTLQYISKLYKTPISTIARWFKKQGRVLRRCGAPTMYTIEDAKELLDQGLTYRQVGAELGVDHSGIYRKVNGKVY